MNSAAAKIPLRSATRIMLFYTVLSLAWFYFSSHGLYSGSSDSLTFWVTLTTFITGITVSGFFLLVWRQQYLQHQQDIVRCVAEKDKLLHHFFDLPLQGMAITSGAHGRWLQFNDHLITLFKSSREELAGLNLLALTHPDDRINDLQDWELMLANELQGYRREKRFVRMDGSILHAIIDSRCIRQTDGTIECVVNVIEDITARKHSELHLIRQNNLYDMLSQTNQVIVRSQDKLVLLQNICRIAVQHGGFVFAWISMLEEEKTVNVASYGHDNGFLQFIDDYRQQVRVKTGTEPRFLVPTDRAIANNTHLILNHFMMDESVRPFHDVAAKAGFQSAGYFVIREKGRVIGALNLYANEPDFFSPAVLSTLNDMVMDVTYALDMLQQAKERAIALTALQNAGEVIDASPTILFRWQPTSSWKLEYVSSNVQRWGYKADDFINGNLTMSDLLHPEDLHRVWAEVIRHIESRHREYILECRIRTADGEYLWVENHVTTSFDRKGKPQRFTGVMTDITQQKTNELQLRQAAIVFESTREGIVITDAMHNIIKVNSALIDLFGYQEYELLGKRPRILRSGKHDESFYHQMRQALEDHGFWRGELWNRTKDGELVPMMTSINPVCDSNGEILYYVSVYTDISQLKDSEARLEHMALHDPLTGLPNRAMLGRKLALGLQDAIKNDERIALLMLDLDHFKNVNDSFGHHFGDELLHQVAARLRRQLRANDVVCRLGGDEFTVLLQNNPSLEDVSLLAEKIIHALHQPFPLSNERDVVIGTSIGISLFPEHSKTAEELMQQADTAMYRAKHDGRDGYRYFSEELFLKAKARLELEQRLHRAIAEQEFKIYYQPQLSIETNEIIGAEALLRWDDPDLGLISPSEFIFVAEETGLIQNIGEWVLYETCRQGRIWLDQHLPNINLAVNLSPLQLHHGDVQQLIGTILQNTGFPAHHLELELTESALMEQQEEAVRILQGLRQQGIRIAIDDFGTGYSSLAYLKQFPLDVLKIDKRFVDDIPHERDDMEIAAAIVAMGHSLRLTVLAEGVETEAQLQFLQQQGCDYYQGYLYSVPIPADEFEQLLREQTQTRKIAATRAEKLIASIQIA
jgi:diguanylate cyclase (GGDEF)-like protein/PAS domain S-box-containing protein